MLFFRIILLSIFSLLILPNLNWNLGSVTICLSLSVPVSHTKMESSTDRNTSTTSSTPISHSPSSSSLPPPPVAFVKTPSAACDIFRSTCAKKCLLTPYFPCTEPAKLTTVHRSFGASNTINFFQVFSETILLVLK